MKITFLALHLGYGGVEKTIASQANILCEKYEVEIICVYKMYDKPPFDINPKVKITYLLDNSLKPNKVEIKEAIKNKKIFDLVKEGIKSIRILRLRKSSMKKAVKACNSEIIISTRLLFNKLLTENCKENTICIAQEHNNPDDIKYFKKMINSIKEMDYIMPVSKKLTSFYNDKLDGNKTKCVYIPHCLDYIPNEVSNLMKANLVSIGRLSKEKGFNDLIDVFKMVNERNQEWKLNIIGDGEERPAIEKKINEYNLNNCVILHGYQNKEYIDEILNTSSIYCMTSYEESFGLVLLEALSHGIPCVAFDSAQGATEIIKNEFNGFLIPNRDKELMKSKIEFLMHNTETRMDFGQNGREYSYNYSKENVEKEWYEFIDTIWREKC